VPAQADRQLAYGTRTQLGDPAFVSGLGEAQKHWVSSEYAMERAALIDDSKTFHPDYYKPPS
jgi:gamma-glutamyltranspeptidase/glutathione hydrolase